MALDQILVTLGGLGLSGLVAWYFWFSESKAVTISSSDGPQEALVVVKGGYSPDVIVVDAGRPVRLLFRREETAVCSEQVLIPDLNKQASLPPQKVVPVEFTIDKPGTYGFQCGMGMLRGKIIAQ